MVSVKIAAIAGFAAVFTTAAGAADMPSFLPPVELPPVEDFAGGWYLRGDIGQANQKIGNLHHEGFAVVTDHRVRDKNFEGGMLFGVGIGYQWNHWLRTDVTGEYRGEVGFHGLDTWTDIYSDPVRGRFNNYTAKSSGWLLLANVYADLGTWYNVTPFVGVGVGAARNTIHSFRDAGVDSWLSPTLAYADPASKWNFAWALHAGLSYKVTPNFVVELAYRYADLGKALTGDIVSYDGLVRIAPMHFRNITSHDLKLGVRWLFDAPQPAPRTIELPPLMRRG